MSESGKVALQRHRDIVDEERRKYLEIISNELDVEEEGREMRELSYRYDTLKAGYSIVTECGIPLDEWEGMSFKVKRIIVGLYRESAKYEDLRMSLEDWLSQMP